MAKIKEMIGRKIISGFKGTLDFYYHDGQACVRMWPRSPGHNRSPAVMAGWAAFTTASREWNNLSEAIRRTYEEMATGSMLSGRDMFQRAYMKGLYREANP